MTKKITLAVFSALFFLGANAQDSASASSSATTFSGSVDAYYRYNLGKGNNLTAFTNSQNSFELGMASLRADHSFGKVSATVDLGFGTRAQEFSYNDANTLYAIKQAYLTYSPCSKVKLTLGKWGTHVGYEVLDAYANKNYSTSYMFTNGPFFHTGLKADITLGKKSTLMLGVANPTDNTTLPASANGGEKAVLAQFGTATKDDKVKAYLNFVGSGYGTGVSTNQIDVVATDAITKSFTLGYNGTIALYSGDGSSANWWGSALYFNYDVKSDLGFTLRTEYFNDDKYKIKVGSNVFEATLSANYKVNGLTIIPELRLDNAKGSLFTDADGSPTKSTVTALLAAVYKF